MNTYVVFPWQEGWESDAGALREREEERAFQGVRSTWRNEWVDKGANKYSSSEEWMMKEEGSGEQLRATSESWG
ncbi:hypothetical protein NQZ68_004057 [Dissostichus eleginoides]|nr:hypothetical protein NQZ68_004057 [Dissostichus eleginoides]